MAKLIIVPDSFFSKFFFRKYDFKNHTFNKHCDIYDSGNIDGLIVFVIKDSTDWGDYLFDMLKKHSVDLVLFAGYSFSLDLNVATSSIVQIDRFSVLPDTMVFWHPDNISYFECGVSIKNIVGYQNVPKEGLCLGSTKSKLATWKLRDWLYDESDISLFDRYGAYVADICGKSNVIYVVCTGVLLKKSKFNMLDKMIVWDKSYSFFELLFSPYKMIPYMILYYRKYLIFKKMHRLIENFVTYNNR
jgi:hypothetical protein